MIHSKLWKTYNTIGHEKSLKITSNLILIEIWCREMNDIILSDQKYSQQEFSLLVLIR